MENQSSPAFESGKEETTEKNVVYRSVYFFNIVALHLSGTKGLHKLTASPPSPWPFSMKVMRKGYSLVCYHLIISIIIYIPVPPLDTVQ